MHPECFPSAGHVVLSRLKNIIASERFILAGGTALALQIGHRISEDLDFFTEKTFSTDNIFQKIKRAGLAPAILQEEEGTLVLIVNNTKVTPFPKGGLGGIKVTPRPTPLGVGAPKGAGLPLPRSIATGSGGIKVSFFRYAYPFIEEITAFHGIRLANVVDIAPMKVIAISQRGAKRDFIDLWFILQTIPFWKIVENMAARFGKDRINPVNIGKSLVYFNDAEEDPEPKYPGKIKPEWKAVKKFFIGRVKQMVLDMETGRGK